MANVKISPDQLGETIESILNQYSDDLIRDMPDIVKEVAQETVKELKAEAGRLFGGTKYKKSFKSKKLAGANGKISYTIYSTEYRLTHLLEKGHVIKNQTGQVYGMTEGRPHWATAESKAVNSMEQKLTEAAKGE